MDSFSIIKPAPVLAPYISHYWAMKAGKDIPAAERVIPTGSVSLIFHRADPLMSFPLDSRQPVAFVSGVSTGYSDVQSTGKLDMLVVVFKPLGSSPFLTVPLDEFRNLSVAVEDTGDSQLIEMAEMVLAEESDSKAVAHIEQFLVSRLYRNDDYHRRRIEAAMRLIDFDPDTNVSAAADTACLSSKHFNRLFSAQVGIRPKEFMRIVRFQRALYILQNHHEINLARLAAECGYYDQAHMIKDFREFSGYTPTEYLAVCAPYSDYFSAP